MDFPQVNTRGDGHLTKQATQVALLAFRCARQHGERQDRACELALKAYLAILPNDSEASDNVISAIVEAVRVRPHWLGLEPVSETAG